MFKAQKGGSHLPTWDWLLFQLFLLLCDTYRISQGLKRAQSRAFLPFLLPSGLFEVPNKVPNKVPMYTSTSASTKASHPRRNRSRSKNDHSTVFIGSKVNAGQMSFKGADLTVDRYLGHVNVDANNDEIRDYIVNSGVKLVDFHENPRSHSSFKSFKITVRRSDLPTMESNTFWPEGVVFRNFFRPKGQRNNSRWRNDGAASSAETGVTTNRLILAVKTLKLI